MMRDIKFRAWDKSIRKYLYDNIAGQSAKGDIFLGGYGYFDGTLEQYTGLKDKNGKEIYEGDILGHSFGIPPKVAELRVYWSDYDGSWCTECFNAAPKDGRLSFFFKEDECGACCGEVEIIGNIHE